MTVKVIESNLLEDLSTEEQQLLTGGYYYRGYGGYESFYSAYYQGFYSYY